MSEAAFREGAGSGKSALFSFCYFTLIIIVKLGK